MSGDGVGVGGVPIRTTEEKAYSIVFCLLCARLSLYYPALHHKILQAVSNKLTDLRKSGERLLMVTVNLLLCDTGGSLYSVHATV